MEEIIVFLVVGGFAVTATIIAPIFYRFRSDELSDQRQLDWKIFVLENGLEPIESITKFNQFLRARLLHLDPLNGEASKAFSIESEEETIYFFDYLQRRNDKNSNGTVSYGKIALQGVCVQFKHRGYPRFHLARPDKFWDSGYVQIHRYLYPEWVPESVQITSGRNDAKEIARFVESNLVLKRIINHRSFSAILFRGPNIVVYFENQLQVSESSIAVSYTHLTLPTKA